MKLQNSWYSGISLTFLLNYLGKYNQIKKDYINIGNNSNFIMDSNYKEWLIGFIDGEGSFRMHIKNGNRCTFDLAFHIHIDDIEVLEKLKFLWGSDNKIVISKNKSTNIPNTCSIAFGSRDIILNHIIPLLDENTLLTNKVNDYLLWKKAYLLHIDNNISLEDKLPIFKDIKNKISNKTPLLHSHNFISNHINMNWFIGYFESKGSFLIRNDRNSCWIQILDSELNRTLLDEIVTLLNNLTPDSNCPINIVKKVPTKLYKDKNNLRIMFTSMDYLYWVFIPNMLKYNFETKKSLWFLLWSVLVISKQHGLIKDDNVLSLLNHIKLTFNKTTSNGLILDKCSFPSINDIISILDTIPKYDINKSHDSNVRSK